MSSGAGRLGLGPLAAGWAPSNVRSIAGAGGQMAVGAAVGIVYLLTIGSEQDSLAFVVVALAAGIAVVSPVAGLALLAIVMPARETELLAPIRVNAILAGATTLGCLLRLPLDRVSLRVHPGFVLLLGYLLVSALSLPPALSGHSPDWTSSAANQLVRLSTGVALFLSALYLFHVMSSRVIIGLALVGATIAALLAIGDFAHFLPFEGLIHGLLSREAGSRASGGFSDANYLGLFMAPAAILALSALSWTRGTLRRLLVPVVILLFVCIAMTFSRGTYLGTFVGVLILIAMRSKPAALVFAIGAGFLALTLYPAFLEARLGGVLSADDAFDLLRSESSRTAVAAAAFAMLASSPVFGVGFGVFQYVSPSYTGDSAVVATFSHNQFLNVLAEQGVVGILFVSGIVVLLAIALRESRSPVRGTAIAMGGAYLVLSLFINSTTSFQGSCLLWLVMAAALAPARPGRAAQVMEA